MTSSFFANTKEKAQNLLDSLVRHLAAAGLMLNTSKTVALTTEAQPPSFIQVGNSHMIKVLGHAESYRWLGCMLCACPGQDSDVEYHLQQAAKAFQKHRWMLQCQDCSIKHRLRYFEAIVFFFSSRLFAAIRSQGAVLLVSFQALGLFLYWPISRCAKSKR